MNSYIQAKIIYWVLRIDSTQRSINNHNNNSLDYNSFLQVPKLLPNIELWDIELQFSGDLQEYLRIIKIIYQFTGGGTSLKIDLKVSLSEGSDFYFPVDELSNTFSIVENSTDDDNSRGINDEGEDSDDGFDLKDNLVDEEKKKLAITTKTVAADNNRIIGINKLRFDRCNEYPISLISPFVRLNPLELDFGTYDNIVYPNYSIIFSTQSIEKLTIRNCIGFYEMKECCKKMVNLKSLRVTLPFNQLINFIQKSSDDENGNFHMDDEEGYNYLKFPTQSRYRYIKNDFNEMCRVIEMNRSITNLTIDNYSSSDHFLDELIIPFTEMIRNNQSIKYLTLKSMNFLTVEFLQAFKDNQTITHLSLYDSLNEHLLETLVDDIFPKSPNIIYFEMLCTNVKNQIQLIRRLISETKTIQHLYLHGCFSRSLIPINDLVSSLNQSHKNLKRITTSTKDLAHQIKSNQNLNNQSIVVDYGELVIK
eukprot:gene2683-3328_t